MQPSPRRAALANFGLLLGLALGECVLRVLERLSTARHTLESDPLLQVRVRPGSGGHDSRGFRNPVALSRADVVAIGDSQTWGVNAEPSQSWPSQLGRKTGQVVYSMSLGGYGVAHYTALVPEALSLRPSTVILGVYVANDVWETYRAVYERGKWLELRGSEDPTLALQTDPVRAAATRYWGEKTAYFNAYGRWPPGDWPIWFRAHSAVGRLLDRLGAFGSSSAWVAVARAWARDNPASAGVYDEGPNDTVFTTTYRLSCLDLEEPRIREGLRLTKILLARAGEELDRAGARAVVLFIPSKERAYAGAFPDLPARIGGAYPALVAAEAAVLGELEASLQAQGVIRLDATAKLARGLRDGERLYPTTEDGHFLPAGYAAIAEVALEALSQGGPTAVAAERTVGSAPPR